jgi:hypothetical protein|tara:strand:+ start:2418 stop:2594 length:177 start_codon:yes stop_codon:yes gene_type:complete
MKEIIEFIEANPEYSEYLVDGEVQWETLGIDIDIERKAIDYVNDAELFISAVSLVDFV